MSTYYSNRKRRYSSRRSNGRRRRAIPRTFRRPHAESKFYDSTVVFASLLQSGEFLGKTGIGPEADTTTIVDIVEGVGQSQRIGRKVTITKIIGRFTFAQRNSESANLTEADEASTAVRLMIYWDKQCNGAAPAPEDLVTTDVWNAFRNLSNTKRFRMLYDKAFTCNSTAIAAGDGAANDSRRGQRLYIKNVNLKVNIPIEYSAPEGDLGDIRSNNIGIMVWAEQSSQVQLLTSKIRVRYSDM